MTSAVGLGHLRLLGWPLPVPSTEAPWVLVPTRDSGSRLLETALNEARWTKLTWSSWLQPQSTRF
jgi:hypothetical protein